MTTFDLQNLDAQIQDATPHALKIWVRELCHDMDALHERMEKMERVVQAVAEIDPIQHGSDTRQRCVFCRRMQKAEDIITYHAKGCPWVAARELEPMEVE